MLTCCREIRFLDSGDGEGFCHCPLETAFTSRRTGHTVVAAAALRGLRLRLGLVLCHCCDGSREVPLEGLQHLPERVPEKLRLLPLPHLLYRHRAGADKLQSSRRLSHTLVNKAQSKWRRSAKDKRQVRNEQNGQRPKKGFLFLKGFPPTCAMLSAMTPAMWRADGWHNDPDQAYTTECLKLTITKASAWGSEPLMW